MEFNTAQPLIMHIDLNSCFATVEQQARPLLRGKPIGIVNRRTEHTMLVAASYEAKALGIGLGTKLKDAKKQCPEFIGLESDPSKYRFVYHKLMNIMNDYSGHVRMKSIDEGVIDFTETTEAIRRRGLESIGREIKQRLRDEIGCAMRCNIGISTNRFLAKTAAGLNKPDGMDVITSGNLLDVYGRLELTDITGIARANAKRLNAVGIFSPLDFLSADIATLEKMVFKSIVGRQWYQRLRGWEVDAVDHDLKSVGRQYVLESHTLTRDDIVQRLHHLCEATGYKLRSKQKVARGVLVWCHARPHGYWHARHMASLPFFSDQAIINQAKALFERAPDRISTIGVTCYGITDDLDSQLSLFGDDIAREIRIVTALDEINNRYGEHTIHSASTLGTSEFVKTKIPFGSTRYL